MDEDLLWAILGLTLVIVELLTGTFYLLVLGVAAFGASLAACQFPAPREAVGMQFARRGIAGFSGKPRKARAKRRHLPRMVMQFDEFLREFGCVHGQVILN